MSTALITTSLTHPIGFITAPLGTYGIIKSSEFGKQIGNVLVNAVDYLTDNVSYKLIDASKPVILKKGDIEIEFSPKEIKFVKSLVKSNQWIERETAIVYKQGSGILKQTNSMAKRTTRVAREFKETTQRASVVISDLKLIKSLDKAVLPTLTERLTRVGNINGGFAEHVPYINTREMQRPMPYMSHTYDHHGNQHAHINMCVDNKHGDVEWRIGFSYNCGGGHDGHNGSRHGGGCSLL
jgi:hypothetical protein